MSEVEPRPDGRKRPRAVDRLARWWPVGALAVVAALAIAVVAHPGPLPGEVAYVRWWQDFGEPVPTIADVVRATTGTEGALVVAAVPAGWLLRRHGRDGAFVVAVAAVTMLVVQPVFKEVVDRPRPTVEQVDVRAENESKSFPSGHSMSTTTVWGAAAGWLWVAGRRRWAIVAAAPVAITFCSSAVQGVHWPTDAIAGTLLGATAAWLMVPRLPTTADATGDSGLRGSG